MCTRAQRIRKGVRSRVTITLFLVVLQPLRSPMLNPNQLQPLKRALMMRIEVRSLSQLSERQAQCICLRRYMNVPAIQPARAAHRRLFLCMDPSFDCSVSMRSKISSSFTINLDILPPQCWHTISSPEPRKMLLKRLGNMFVMLVSRRPSSVTNARQNCMSLESSTSFSE